MTQEKQTQKQGIAKPAKRYIIAAMAASLASAAFAADLPVPQPLPDVAATDPITDYFLHWFDRSNAAKASQSHWMTPITTVTPRLEQEYRYDQTQQFLQNGAEINNYFNGKGLELIPTETNEILINVAPFMQRFSEGTKVKPATGFADWNFVTIKQRILSANEENGNYILTVFLGAQAPTGAPAFTNRAWVITPTIAGGIGWGDFDVQGTIGYAFPTANQHAVGTALLTNVTLQYHFWEYFWPELGFNDTQWTSGVRAGRNQLFLSPGIMFGRFNLYKDLVKFNFGIGYQVAVVPDHAIMIPLTPLYNHAWILSARVTF